MCLPVYQNVRFRGVKMNVLGLCKFRYRYCDGLDIQSWTRYVIHKWHSKWAKFHFICSGSSESIALPSWTVNMNVHCTYVYVVACVQASAVAYEDLGTPTVRTVHISFSLFSGSLHC